MAERATDGREEYARATVLALTATAARGATRTSARAAATRPVEMRDLSIFVFKSGLGMTGRDRRHFHQAIH